MHAKLTHLPVVQHFREADMHSQRILLQKEEARLSEALSSIRSQMNELLPISILPPETLEEIFEICVSWLYGCQKPKHRLAWTQVCCSWRRISLNSSRLWQRIDLCDARFADEFLLRSKQAPLSIVSTSPLKLTVDKDSLRLHASRLRSIDVFLFPNDMLSLFASTGRDLPSLVSLSLRVPPASPLLLNLSAPRARRLFLDSVGIRWGDCQGLTHLTLRGLNDDLCPSIPQLHAIFAASPNLTYIRLENILPRIDDVPHAQPTALMHLKDMIISSKPSLVRSILAGVYLGPNTRLQLYLSLSEDLHTLFPRGLPYLTHHRHTITSPTPPAPDFNVHTVRLSRHGANFIRGPIEGRRDGAHANARAWDEDPAQMIFALSSASSLSTRVCSSLDHLIDLSRVRALELNTGVLLDIPLRALQSVFVNLTSLDTLRIAFNDLDDLLSILQAAGGTPVEEDGATCEHSEVALGRRQFCLPRLSRLSFSKPSDLWWHFGERWILPVIKCIETRRQYTTPIETLQFFRCHGITPAAAKALEELVPRVIISEQLGRRSSM